MPALLGTLVILAAILAIVRQYDVRLVLFSAGLALGALAGQTDVIVREFLITFADGKFIVPICSAMGFSYVLRLTECDQHLVRLLVRPLVRARSFLVPGTVLIGFVVNMPVVSQASTALAIGPVVIPILRAARVPAVVIGAALLLGSSIGGELFNPGAPELSTVVRSSTEALQKAIQAADPAASQETLDQAANVFTTSRCIERLRPLNLLGLAVATSLFWWRSPATSESDESSTPDLTVNYAKAVVPVIPIILLMIFAPGVGLIDLPHHWLDESGASGLYETRLIGAAMLVGVGCAVMTTPRKLPAAADSFFQGAGYGFANIISIIVAANCFGKGLELIGLAKVITENLGGDPRVLIVVAGVSSLGFAVLCGSGFATAKSLFPFFAATALEKGIDPTHVGAVVSLAAAAGRTMSPLAAVNQMCARLTDTRAIDLSRQVVWPLLAGVAAIIIAATIWIPSP